MSDPAKAVSPRRRAARLGLAFLLSALAGVPVVVVGLTFQAVGSVINPPRDRDPALPSDRGLAFERVRFPSRDGLDLAGWVLPGGPAGVVVAHGHGGSKAGMLAHAEFLNREGGYTVLLFDFRNSGESAAAVSTLGYHEWQDVAGGIDYLGGRHGVDRRRMAVLGVSLGAAASLMLGGEAQGVRAVVADSSFATAESLVGRFDRWFRLPSWPFSALVPLAVQFQVGLKPADVAPVARVGDIAPTPVLIIHGADDAGIPAQDAQRLYDAAGNPKELWIVLGAPHGGGHAVAGREYRARVLGFLARHLSG